MELYLTFSAAVLSLLFIGLYFAGSGGHVRVGRTWYDLPFLAATVKE